MKTGNVQIAGEKQLDELRICVEKSVNKLRGRIDVDTAQGWIGNSDALDSFVEKLLPPEVTQVVEQIKKFALLVDLGTITVPDDYVHATHLTAFKAKHQGGRKKSFYSYNGAITDANFPNPTRVLKPGDTLHVRAWKQIVEGTTTTKERMDFLATRKSVYTGAQGASFVFEQKRDQLPKGYWYASFDEKKRLWEDADGRHRVPNVRCDSDGGFRFDLGYFERVWYDRNAFLDFSDE